jgi:hypothetical protein
MPQITLELDAKSVKELILPLPPSDWVALVDDVNERAETIQMMHWAETGFREWDEEEEFDEAKAPSPRNEPRKKTFARANP